MLGDIRTGIHDIRKNDKQSGCRINNDDDISRNIVQRWQRIARMSAVFGVSEPIKKLIPEQRSRERAQAANNAENEAASSMNVVCPIAAFFFREGHARLPLMHRRASNIVALDTYKAHSINEKSLRLVAVRESLGHGVVNAPLT